MNIDKVLSEARAHYDRNNTADAKKHLQRILKKKPAHGDANHLLGFIYLQEGNYSDAARLLKKALISMPRNAEIHLHLGNALVSLLQLHEAIAYFQKAIQLDPLLAEAHASLGNVYERSNDLDMAAKHIEQALKLKSYDPTINYYKAVLLRRQGDIEGAIETLKPFANTNTPDKALLTAIYFEMGKLYDTSGDRKNAFDYFSLGNNLQKQFFQTPPINSNKFISEIRGLSEWFGREQDYPWPNAIGDINTGPVIFLVGFPRSGTTLMDQILDSHSGIQVMEEIDVIGELINEIGRNYGGYPSALTTLDAACLDKLRNKYFAIVDRHMDRDTKSILVDKLPFNIRNIPLITRLFPNTRVLFALRHPYDVVLSNFMQYFQINDAMSCFLDIEDTALTYELVMNLWKQYVACIPLKLHTIKYENLVDNFEETTRKLFSFLELEWEESALKYDQHAKNKGFINTPSYQSVSKPIYDDARFRWKKYEGQLETIIARLKPFADDFGY